MALIQEVWVSPKKETVEQLPPMPPSLRQTQGFYRPRFQKHCIGCVYKSPTRAQTEKVMCSNRKRILITERSLYTAHYVPGTV